MAQQPLITDMFAPGQAVPREGSDEWEVAEGGSDEGEAMDARRLFAGKGTYCDHLTSDATIVNRKNGGKGRGGGGGKRGRPSTVMTTANTNAGNHYSINSQCAAKCRANQNCVAVLDNALAKQWRADNALETFLKRNTPEHVQTIADLARIQDAPIGLKNLAATCYLNTLLQVWFHNIPLRTAVYNYELGLCDEQSDVIMRNLKTAFAYMQYGSKNVFDPRKFVDSLRIDSGMQQDAQEFSKLFTSTLEHLFSHQRRPELKNLVLNLFEGECAYVTRCKTCKYESRRPESFRDLELTITDSSLLTDSLANYLHEEHLDDANKWYCPHCASKQPATRQIALARLPRVLNLQLLRFVYDVARQIKRKVRAPVRFPRVLDLRAHTGDAADVFEVSGALLHRGASAYAGHFIARIREPVGGAWFTFNDEVVERVERLGFDLVDVDVEEDEGDGWMDVGEKRAAGKKGKGKGKTAVGGKKETSKVPSPVTQKWGDGIAAVEGSDEKLFTSSVAYMLVYTRCGEWDASRAAASSCVPPPALLSEIRSLNSSFDTDRHVYEERQGELKALFERQREFREAVAACWRVRAETEPCYYVDARELKAWFLEGLVASGDVFEEAPEDVTAKGEVGESEKQEEKVEGAVFTGLETVEGTTACAAGIAGPVKTMFDNSQLVCEHGKLWHTKVAHSKRISKAAGDLLIANGYIFKPVLTEDDCCLTCAEKVLGEKKSLSNHVENVETFRMLDKLAGEQDQFWISSEWLKEWIKKTPFKDFEAGMPLPTSDEYLQDVMCPHGMLLKSHKKRRLVSEPALEVLRTSLRDPLVQLLPKSAEECIDCAEAESALAVEKAESVKRASIEKAALKKLFDAKHLPASFSKTGRTFFVPAEFIMAWREFLRNPLDKLPPGEINNRIFLCEHNALCFDPQDKNDDSPVKAVYLHENDWFQLHEWYDANVLVEASRAMKPNGDEFQVFDPEVCQTCKLNRINQKPDVYIRVINISDTSPALESADSPGGVCVDLTSQKVNGNGKRKQQHALFISNGSDRRQSKRLKDKTNLEFKIDKRKTVLDLKSQITSKWDVPPIHQQLYFKSKELTMNSCTIASLNVGPTDVFEVKLLKEQRGLFDDEHFSNTGRLKEMGFAGSNLLGFGSEKRSGSGSFTGDVDMVEADNEDLQMALAMQVNEVWQCGTCTFLNEEGGDQCSVCQTARF
ncbi:hypothetical protein BC830DRAFT_1163468 [Chytriomyces sp. MP71]|nr:hypothetical protein BC830DRAFT_1163468 [Chytriomyces sp. MP71]